MNEYEGYFNNILIHLLSHIPTIYFSKDTLLILASFIKNLSITSILLDAVAKIRLIRFLNLILKN